MANSVQSDYQLRQATQVAYLDLGDRLKEKGYSVSRGLNDKVLLTDILTEAEMKKLDQFGDDWKEWSVIDVCDKNGTTGMFGCVLDTGDGNATVAFRGSEGMGDPWNLKTDWGENDFAMLGEVLTPQQENAEAYARYLADSGLLDGYQNICSTGHSLGGNLSDVFALELSNHPNVWDRFDGSTSFDGPGFNGEFLISHASEISRAASRMTHYRWSVVGSCLYPIPGAVQVDLATTGYYDFVVDYGEKDSGLLGEVFWETVQKHDTRSLMFNEEDGSAVVASSPDALIMATHAFTEALALLPLPLRQAAVFVVATACSIPEALSVIASYIDRFVDAAIDFGTQLVSDAIEIGTQIYTWGKGVVINAAKGLKELAEDAWDTVTGTARDMWKGFQQGVAAVGGVVSYFSSWGGSIADWLFGSGSSSGGYVGGWDAGYGSGYGGGGFRGASANGVIWIDTDSVLYSTHNLLSAFICVDALFNAIGLVETCLNLLTPFGWFYEARSSLNGTKWLVEEIEQDMRDLISSVEASATGYQNLERALVLRCSYFG